MGTCGWNLNFIKLNYTNIIKYKKVKLFKKSISKCMVTIKSHELVI